MDSSAPAQIDCSRRYAVASRQLKRVKNESYLEELVGTIGADPSVIVKS
jgi:hypothetical protein